MAKNLSLQLCDPSNLSALNLGFYHKVTKRYIIHKDTLNLIKTLNDNLVIDSQIDNADQFSYRVWLGQLDVVKKHLIPILLNHWINTELFDATLRSLQNLTSPLVLLMLKDQKNRCFETVIISHLQCYKEMFANVYIWSVLRKKLTEMWQVDSSREVQCLIDKLLMLISNVKQFEAHIFRGWRCEHDDIIHNQNTRSHKILALVPKSRAKSDEESSESSEDEIRIYGQSLTFDDSSPARSLASSLENINISDSDEGEYREVFTIATIHEEPGTTSSILQTVSRSKNISDSTPNSPSILQNFSDIIPPTPSLYIPPSPSIESNYSPAPEIVTTTPLRVGRSKKRRLIVKKTKIPKPTKLLCGIQNIMRYKKEEKRKGPVTCPNLIKHYNASMGGVDLADMLVALYRTDLKGHRWYLPIFSQILDIGVNNAWLLYRQENRDKQKLMPLKKFRVALFRELCSFERSPSDLQPDALTKSVKKVNKPVAERPDDATRYDLVGHLPTFTTKGRCRNCTKNQTKYFCQKCNARLCIIEGRNCFLDFHVTST